MSTAVTKRRLNFAIYFAYPFFNFPQTLNLSPQLVTNHVM